MSVQQNVQLYQTSKGVGVIGENQPYDTKSFIVAETANDVGWGVFVKRLSTSNGADANKIKEFTAETQAVVGATVKQLDRVDGEVLGIVKDSEGNSSSVFYLSAGKPANVMRMGYLSMPCVGSWIEGRLSVTNKVYVRTNKTVSTDLVGEVANDYSALTVPADWSQFPLDSKAAIFADSSDTGTGQVATVYFDLRVPVSLEAATNT